jgi:hypothetical protein
LRHEKHCGADIEHAQVHLACGIRKHTVSQDPLGEATSGPSIVRPLDAHENKEPALNGGYAVTLYSHCSLRNPLDERYHPTTAGSSSEFRIFLPAI